MRRVACPRHRFTSSQAIKARLTGVRRMSYNEQSANRTIKTKFLIISDTHGAQPRENSQKTQPFRDPLPEADVLLHCGDLSYKGDLSEYEGQIEYLKKARAELKLVIAGNHDLSLDKEYWIRRSKDPRRGAKYRNAMNVPDEAIAQWTRPDVREAGVRYLEEGFYTFQLKSGALLRIFASPYQPEFFDWAFQYPRNTDRWNPAGSVQEGYNSTASNPIPDFPNVDVVMTHGPPAQVLDRNFQLIRCGCVPLLHASHRARPKLHCFGHIHEGNGAARATWAGAKLKNTNSLIANLDSFKVDKARAIKDRCVEIDCSSSSATPVVHGESTVFVNAAIRTALFGQRPIQPPWLVHLDLPAGEHQYEAMLA